MTIYIYIYIICPQVSSATPKIPSFWGQKSSFLCCCSTFHMFLIWGHSLSPASFIWFTGSSASLISLQLAVNRLLLEPKTYRYPKWWHPPPGSSRLVNDLNELLVKKQYWLPYIHCLSPTMLIALVMLWSNHFSIWAAAKALNCAHFLLQPGILDLPRGAGIINVDSHCESAGGGAQSTLPILEKDQTSQSQHPYGEFLWSVSAPKMFSQRWRRLPKI